MAKKKHSALGKRLIASAKEMAAHAKGQLDLEVYEVEVPPQVDMIGIHERLGPKRTWRMEMPGPCSVRLEPQFGNSLNPRPLRIIGTHFSARAALVFACFADETWKMYDFLRPGVSVANADLRTALSSSLLCNSSGIGYSEGFFRSIFVPDSSNSMAS